MMDDKDGCANLVAIAVCAFLFFGSLGFRGCEAVTQANVYRREGIEMSTWEVFIGCRPAERTINVK